VSRNARILGPILREQKKKKVGFKKKKAGKKRKKEKPLFVRNLKSAEGGTRDGNLTHKTELLGNKSDKQTKEREGAW